MFRISSKNSSFNFGTGCREPLQGKRTEEVEFVPHSQKKFSSFKRRHNHSCAPQQLQALFHWAQRLISSCFSVQQHNSPALMGQLSLSQIPQHPTEPPVFEGFRQTVRETTAALTVPTPGRHSWEASIKKIESQRDCSPEKTFQCFFKLFRKKKKILFFDLILSWQASNLWSFPQQGLHTPASEIPLQV